MPQKPAKFGIKFWMLCDATTYYVLQAFPYVGKEDREGGLGEHVVLSLMEAYKNCGLNVTTDNLFTSLALARKLLERNTTIIGTIRSHRREIPSDVQLGKNTPLYTSKFVFTHSQENIMLLSYKAKKNKVVYLLSSLHNVMEVDDKAKKKPRAILDYNASKGGVDTADEMLRAYSTKAASRRWPLAAFFNLLDIVTLDAYVICKDVQITIKKRRDFIIELGEKLCLAEKNRRRTVPQVFHLKRTREHAEEELPLNKRTKCKICQSNKTRVQCSNCSKFVCGTCITPVCKSCFEM